MSAQPYPLNREAEGNTIRVLLVSPNARLRRGVCEKLNDERWHITEAGSGAEALASMCKAQNHIILFDPMLPDLDSGEFATMTREQFPNVQILSLDSSTGQLILGNTSPTEVSGAIARSLYAKESQRSSPLSPAQLHKMRLAQDGERGIRGMVGDSDSMRHVFSLTHMVARRDTTVLVTGESGTGKDLIAQAVHLISGRQKQPLVVINCAAIPEALLETELFGYVKGSFTGAVQSRVGRIHAAHMGTLFLDEIGDMPMGLQSKLLRFLEQGEVQRVGSTDTLKVDVRVVAATNADLLKRVKDNLFREDLYYRLSIFPISLPPLREHLEDIPKLCEIFINKFAPGARMSEDAMSVLRGHRWPGNVRELRNVVERATILAGAETEIQPWHVTI
jgi:transcriptional regulator with GAF, ATPase, and Fis domain